MVTCLALRTRLSSYDRTAMANKQAFRFWYERESVVGRRSSTTAQKPCSPRLCGVVFRPSDVYDPCRDQHDRLMTCGTVANLKEKWERTCQKERIVGQKSSPGSPSEVRVLHKGSAKPNPPARRSQRKSSVDAHGGRFNV